MSDPMGKLISELNISLNVQVDEFIVQRIVGLFKEGVLSLEYNRPYSTWDEYPYTSLDKDNVTITAVHEVRLRYAGDEKITELEAKIKELEDEIRIYTSQIDTKQES